MCRGGLVGSELGTLFALGWARFLVGAAATLVGQIAVVVVNKLVCKFCWCACSSQLFPGSFLCEKQMRLGGRFRVGIVCEFVLDIDNGLR